MFDDLPGTITALGTLVAAIGALTVSLLNARSARAARDKAIIAAAVSEANKAELVSVGGELRELGKAVNGRLSRLLETTEAAALARGREEGVAAEKKRVAAEHKAIGKAVKEANGHA